MDFFVKCANVAFSVVPGRGDRDEIEFEFDILVWFGFAPYAVSSPRIYLPLITRPVEDGRLTKTVVVRPSVLQ